MALQTSGQISLDDIATEFNDTGSHALSEFYGAAIGAPTSGVVNISDFYGLANEQVFAIPHLTSSTNLFSAAGSPSQAGAFRFVVGGSSTVGILRVGNFPVGSIVTIENHGNILGTSGAVNSGAGGNAIISDRAAITLNIENTGIIGGGGGGGGRGGNGGTGGGGQFSTTSAGAWSGYITSINPQVPQTLGGIFWGTAVHVLALNARYYWGGVAKGSTSSVAGVTSGHIFTGAGDGYDYQLGGYTGNTTTIGSGKNAATWQIWTVRRRLQSVTTVTNTNGGAGGAGGNGGRGAGFGVAPAAGSGGAAGAFGGTNAGRGGTGGTGGTGGGYGSAGNTGNTGATGASGNRTGGSAGSGGSGGGAAGRAIFVHGGVTPNIANSGSIFGAIS